jgi:hypothetical protein
MRFNLTQLKKFSLCPAYYWFEESNRSHNLIPTRQKIITRIIQKTYLRQNEDKHIIPWRTILNWTNKEVFKIIDIKQPDAYEKIKILTESIITPLNTWYFDIFKKERVYGYINVPISTMINGIEIYDTVPVIKSTETITAVTIDNLVYTDVKMYNDFISRGFLYLLSKNLGTDKIRIEHLTIGVTSKLERTVIIGSQKLNQRMGQVLQNLSFSIASRVNYPSYTEMCDNCQYKKDCVL